VRAWVVLLVVGLIRAYLKESNNLVQLLIDPGVRWAQHIGY
jgi:hypothetical protein